MSISTPAAALTAQHRPDGSDVPRFRSRAVRAATLPRLAVDGGVARLPGRGYIGWKVGGRVDAVDAALVGGALTGAGLGAVQWWAAKGALGRAAAWIGASAVGYAVGLAAGAALVGYDTDLGALALMGLVSGAALGAAQGLVLARQGRRALALPWALAMPVLFALGWSRGIGHRHRRRRPVHGVRRRRRAACSRCSAASCSRASRPPAPQAA